MIRFNGKREAPVSSLVLDKKSPFSRLHHQLTGSYCDRDETRCVSSNETRTLRVRRQGVASKRPDEAARRKFRFCFPILRRDRVPFSFRRIFEPIRPGAARFLALSHLNARCLHDRLICTKFQARLCSGENEFQLLIVSL